MKDEKDLTAPCVLDCFNFDLHESNLTNELWVLNPQSTHHRAYGLTPGGSRRLPGNSRVGAVLWWHFIQTGGII
jgi:hypothetical protein